MAASEHPAHTGAAGTPLVGRAREQGILRASLAAALEGRGGLALLGGAAGVGKTTLAEVLARPGRGRRHSAGVQVRLGVTCRPPSRAHAGRPGNEYASPSLICAHVLAPATPSARRGHGWAEEPAQPTTSENRTPSGWTFRAAR